MLILLRHGRTASNALGLFQGRTDTELDEVGHIQARAAAEAIGPVDRVIASPLRRAAETAEYLPLFGDAQVEIDRRLTELSYGDYDGRPLGEVTPQTWSEWRSDPDFALPGGESLTELRSRVWPCLTEISESARDSDVVVVTHMSPIKSAVQWALGVPEEISWQLHLSTGSITRIDVQRSRPVLRSFNDTAHHPLLSS